LNPNARETNYTKKQEEYISQVSSKTASHELRLQLHSLS